MKLTELIGQLRHWRKMRRRGTCSGFCVTCEHYEYCKADVEDEERKKRKEAAKR